MRYKQLIATLMCAILIIPTTSASATEGTEVMQNMENSLNDSSSNVTSSNISSGSFDLSSANLDGVFSDMANALNSGTSLSLSQAIQNNSDYAMSSDSQYDLSDINLISSTMSSMDMGVLNTEFQSLSSSMADSYTNLDLSGKSQNCMDLFNSTYGNLAEQLTLDNPEIPEGFTVANMINSASDLVNSAYSDASNSDSFSSVKGSVSIGKIFSVANEGLSMASLASESEMQGLISGLNASNYATAMSSYQSAASSAASNLQNSSELYSQANSNFLNVVDMSGSMMSLDGSINKKNLKKAISNADKTLSKAVGDKYDLSNADEINTFLTIGRGVRTVVNAPIKLAQKAAQKVTDLLKDNSNGSSGKVDTGDQRDKDENGISIIK